VIDFRYHLVSIVSVFLALAVGIVLGAGPLQSGIGSTLGDQVVALRAEKEALRTRLDESEKLVGAADEYASGIRAQLVSGRLEGRTVAVVVLPDTESDLVKTTQETLAASGAAVTTTLTLSEDWYDAALADDRSKAAEAAATALGLSSDATGDALLQQVVARLAVATDPGQASASRTAALKVLVDAGLVDSSSPEPVPAEVAVVVSGAFSGSQDVVDARAASVRELVLALDASSDTTVVAGGAPVQAAGQPLTSDAVAAVRTDNESSAEVSTVDHARDGMGPSVVVLAIVAQLADQVGHYGVSEGATAVVPVVEP
jgi:hypothetical protein